MLKESIYLEKEPNISQFVDETNIFGVDNSFVENAFVTIKNFGGILGLQLDVKKQTNKRTNKQKHECG